MGLRGKGLPSEPGYADGIQAFAQWNWGHRLRRERGGQLGEEVMV